MTDSAPEYSSISRETLQETNAADFLSRYFAPGPARDNRFSVKEKWSECENLSEGNPNRILEFLHRQMNEEVDGMECSAQNIADFPDVPWELRMKMARQVYDEARHVLMFKRLYCERGGIIGRYSVLNFQYRIITKIPTLLGRLAVQNRLFETEGVDAIEPEVERARSSGDEDMAQLFESQLADEIGHVRYANDYIHQVTKESPIKVMEVGRAMSQASEAFLFVMGEEAIEATTYSINESARLEAGFRPSEVAFAKDLKESHALAKTNER